MLATTLVALALIATGTFQRLVAVVAFFWRQLPSFAASR